MASIGSVRRWTDEGKAGGLAAGLARSWNVDPVLVRVAFVILAVSGGIGVLLYLLGWVMIPADGRDSSHLDEAIPRTRRWPKELRVAIVVAVCLIGTALLSSLAPFSLVAAVVLAAVWYFGHYKHRRPRPRNSGDPTGPAVGGRSAEPAPHPERTQFFDYPGEPTPFTAAATAWQQRIVAEQRAAAEAHRSARAGQEFHAGQASESGAASPLRPADAPAGEDERRAAFLSEPDPVGLYTPAVDPDPVAEVDLAARRKLARRRSGRRLGLIGLIVFGLTMTGLGVASALGASISAGTYLAAALLVIGLTLVAGTRYGRPPGTVLAAFLVSMVLIGHLFAQHSPLGDVSYREVSYSDVSSMRSDALGTGQLAVDLRDLDLQQSHHYSASVQTGRLEVTLPRDVPVRITGSVDSGMLTIPGQEDRMGSDLEYVSPDPTGGDPVLTLDLDVHRGQLEVRR